MTKSPDADNSPPAADIAVDIAVNIAINGGVWPDEPALQALVDAALGATVALLDEPEKAVGELSVLFADDAEISDLNNRFRGRRQATNVLSFPAAPAPGPVSSLGDIVLASETVANEALSGGLTPDHHIIHLLVHGFLHLLGFDHVNERDAKAMEELETAILARLDIADPHADA